MTAKTNILQLFHNNDFCSCQSSVCDIYPIDFGYLNYCVKCGKPLDDEIHFFSDEEMDEDYD